jgi:hypothetical protein
MEHPLLKLALAEEADLDRQQAEIDRRRAAVRQLIQAYGGRTTQFKSKGIPAVASALPVALPTEGANQEPRRPTTSPQRSPKTERVLAVVTAAMSEADGRPIPLQVLLARTLESGIDVGGKKPASTLSAMLSNAGGFVSVRGEGWRIRRSDEQSESNAQVPAGPLWHVLAREEAPTAENRSGASNPGPTESRTLGSVLD